MSAERMNPESPASAWQPAQPDAAPSFAGPAAAEKSVEKKEKKKKSKDRKSGQAAAAVSPDGGSKKPDSESGRHEPKPLAEIFEETLWDRNKDNEPKQKADNRPMIIGEKAFAAVGEVDESIKNELPVKPEQPKPLRQGPREHEPAPEKLATVTALPVREPPAQAQPPAEQAAAPAGVKPAESRPDSADGARPETRPDRHHDQRVEAQETHTPAEPVQEVNPAAGRHLRLVEPLPQQEMSEPAVTHDAEAAAHPTAHEDVKQTAQEQEQPQPAENVIYAMPPQWQAMLDRQQDHVAYRAAAGDHFQPPVMQHGGGDLPPTPGGTTPPGHHEVPQVSHQGGNVYEFPQRMPDHAVGQPQESSPEPPPTPPPLPEHGQSWHASPDANDGSQPGGQSYASQAHNTPGIGHANRAPAAEQAGAATAAVAAAGAAAGAEAARMAAATGGAIYESAIPPGLQRSASDVSKAAIGAGLFGWWLGRRGKRRAVERARRDAARSSEEQADRAIAQAQSAQYDAERRAKLTAEQQYRPPRLEAEPVHQYPAQELARTVIQPVSVESRPAAAPVPAAFRVPERAPAAPAAIDARMTGMAAERPSGAARTAEAVAVPVAAAVATFERVRPHTSAERAELPRAARLAAARAAEHAVAAGPEVAVAAPGARSERQLGKRELLKVAKDIKIDGVPLKEIYKSKRIDEAGLRAVVDTYLRGGDVRQQLSKEVAMKERSYEIDPMLRRQQRNAERERQKKGGERMSRVKEQAGGVLGQAMGVAMVQGGKVAAATGKTAKKASKVIAKGAKTAQRDLIDDSNTFDWLSITAVVILYSIILLLFLGR